MDQWILTLLTFVPVVGAVVILSPPVAGLQLRILVPGAS